LPFLAGRQFFIPHTKKNKPPNPFGSGGFIIYPRFQKKEITGDYLVYSFPPKKWIVEAILKLVADFGCGAYLAYVSNPKSSKMPQ